jgi:hypothetical protein
VLELSGEADAIIDADAKNARHWMTNEHDDGDGDEAVQLTLKTTTEQNRERGGGGGKGRQYTTDFINEYTAGANTPSLFSSTLSRFRHCKADTRPLFSSTGAVFIAQAARAYTRRLVHFSSQLEPLFSLVLKLVHVSALEVPGTRTS